MKKIILLLIGLTVISCGGDDDDTSGCLVCDKAVILTTDGANQERTEYTWCRENKRGQENNKLHYQINVVSRRTS